MLFIFTITFPEESFSLPSMRCATINCVPFVVKRYHWYFFHYLQCWLTVDSMDKKIQGEDLSDMDMNTVLLMRFSFGQLLKCQRWKREIISRCNV